MATIKSRRVWYVNRRLQQHGEARISRGLPSRVTMDRGSFRARRPASQVDGWTKPSNTARNRRRSAGPAQRHDPRARPAWPKAISSRTRGTSMFTVKWVVRGKEADPLESERFPSGGSKNAWQRSYPDRLVLRAIDRQKSG
jgi:hypothetical protein